MIQETQRTAFKELKNKQNKQLDVLQAIKELRGATFFELVKRLDWPVNTITGRVNELVKIGLVVDSGQRRLNPITQKKGIVWILKSQTTF